MNTHRLCVAVAAAAVLAATASAQITISNVTYGVARSAGSANTDITEETLGYVMVKYSAAVGSSANAKGYFRFDTSGKNPNTNANATFTFNRYYNSDGQQVKFWVLNQAVNGRTTFTNITYNLITPEAGDLEMANDLSSNDLLTNGTPSATFLEDRYISSTAGSTNPTTFTLTAPWGQYLFGGKLVLVMTGGANAGNGAGGMRISLNSAVSSALGATNPPARVTFLPIISGAPPSISAVADVTTTNALASATLNFTISDPNQTADTLVLSATSSDEAVVSSNNITLGGSGGARTISVVGSNLTPGNVSARVTVTATDSAGNIAQRTFTVTVVPGNLFPTISTPAKVYMTDAASVEVAFTVNDAETPAANLNVVGSVSSLSAGVVAGVTIGGSGTDRTATITPVSGADGVAIVNLDVSDLNTNTTRISFAVMVLPVSSGLVFSDHFGYANLAGQSYGNLLSGSMYLWTNRSSGSVNLRTTNSAALVRGNGSGESLKSALVGAPIASGPLYVGFNARWLTVVTNGGSDLVHLYSDGGVGFQYRLAKVGVNAPDPTNAPWNFRVRIQTATSPYVLATNELTTNTLYGFVVRYNVDNLSEPARLWVNPSVETDPYTDAGDFISQSFPITDVGLRQDVGNGDILIDNLKVGTTFAAVLPSTAAPPTVVPYITGVRVVGAEVQIDFTGDSASAPSSFSLVSATEVVAGITNPVSATMTSLGSGSFRATTAVSGNPRYYRIKQ